MAEFLSIGAQCAFPACRQLDFLPVKCDFCSESFCTEHSFPENHNCSQFAREKPLIPKGPDGPSLYFACEYRDCKGREMTKITCPHCHITTCLNHRHPKDHDCPSLVPSTEIPLANTKEHISNLASSSSGVKPRKPKSEKAKQTMARVQLMKLKMKSVGAKSIPTDDRVYFKVLRPDKRPPLGIFVSKDWSLGKALDSIASLADVVNRNNEATQKEKLLLFHFEEGNLVAGIEDMSLSIEELLRRDELINGETLILDIYSGQNVDPSKYINS